MKILLTIVAELDSAQLPNYNMAIEHSEYLSSGLMKDFQDGYLGFNDLEVKNFTAQKVTT